MTTQKTTKHRQPTSNHASHDKPARSLPASVIEAQALDKAIDVVQILREISPAMTLNQVLVFLEIARRDGVEALTVRQKFELPSSSMSQIIAVLSATSYQKKDGKSVDGYNLVIQSDNFDDGRAKNLHLTPKGKKITEKIINKIND